MTDLTNPRAERVRAVKRLSGRSARRRAGLFIAEGPSCVREALATGSAADVYATADGLARHPELTELIEHTGTRLFTCTEVVLAELADTVTPQGVLAVCPLPQRTLADVLAGGSASRDGTPRLIAVLAHVRDPGNAGTVIRAADATGADAVVLTEASVDPYNPKCVRSTTGSIFHVPVVAGPSLADVVSVLRAAGCQMLAADGAGDEDLDAMADEQRLGDPTAWVFGNEAWGMSQEDRDLADAVVRVPIHGRAESLNLAMAATVCLYASARAQR